MRSLKDKIAKIRKIKQLRGLETSYLNKIVELAIGDAYRIVIDRAGLTDEDLGNDHIVNAAYFKARKLVRHTLVRYINCIV